MKVRKNEEHNSIEIDFEGVKPSAEVRMVLKAYGFWWYQKEKVWCHSLVIDGDFFENFVDERIRPLVEQSVSKERIADAVAAMSEADKQALLAQLMGK